MLIRVNRGIAEFTDNSPKSKLSYSGFIHQPGLRSAPSRLRLLHQHDHRRGRPCRFVDKVPDVRLALPALDLAAASTLAGGVRPSRRLNFQSYPRAACFAAVALPNGATLISPARARVWAMS